MKQISKEDLQPATTPGDGWFIIEAAGQHATRRGEVEFTQNLSPEVLAGIVEAGVPSEGLPIDRDHLSLDARNSTEALGWLRELAMCDGNLAGRIEWTPLGLPLIQGRVYKHFSTVYPPPGEQLAGGEYMPERLIGLALTNQPNNKEGQPPITNSRERVGEVRGTRLRSCGATPRQANDPSSPIGYAEAGDLRMENSAPEAQEWEEDEAGYLWTKDDFSEGEVPKEAENNTNEEPTMYSPELLSALGLPEGATEADVLAAVQKLKQSAEVANAAVKKAEAAEADAVINAAERENGVELSAEEKEEAKQHIITNRAHGLKYVGLLCRDKRPAAAATEQPVANTRRYAGKMPLVNRSTPEDGEKAIANRAQQLCDEARAAGKHLGYFTAMEMARTEAARNK